MTHYHSDNRMVKNGRESCEYLCIGENEASAEKVFLYRYFRPGRRDVYGFGLRDAESERSSRLTYWSESDCPLPRAVAALMKDLEKAAIVEMFSRFARSSRYHVTMLHFLEGLAPKSSATKAFRRAQKARMKKWRALKLRARTDADRQRGKEAR